MCSTFLPPLTETTKSQRTFTRKTWQWLLRIAQTRATLPPSLMGLDHGCPDAAEIQQERPGTLQGPGSKENPKFLILLQYYWNYIQMWPERNFSPTPSLPASLPMEFPESRTVGSRPAQPWSPVSPPGSHDPGYLCLRSGHSRKGASRQITAPSLHHSPLKIHSFHFTSGQGRIYISLCAPRFPVLLSLGLSVRKHFTTEVWHRNRDMLLNSGRLLHRGGHLAMSRGNFGATTGGWGATGI